MNMMFGECTPENVEEFAKALNEQLKTLGVSWRMINIEPMECCAGELLEAPESVSIEGVNSIIKTVIETMR